MNRLKKSDDRSGHSSLDSINRIAPCEYRVIDDVIQALVAYSVPTSVATSCSGTKSSDSTVASSKHLTTLLDSHNIANIGRNKNVTSEFIQNGGISPMADYQGLVVDESSGMIFVECCFISCGAKLPLVQARHRFKSCHHCYTYYCCSQCRQQDWSNHKVTVCPMGRAVSAIKAVIKRLLMDEATLNTFSNLGRGGYLRMGRGCVVVWFSNCLDAERFAQDGMQHLKDYPVFVCIKNIHLMISRFVLSSLSTINEACKSYDPDTSMVVNISVSVDENLLNRCPSKIRHFPVHAIKKCVTISLSNIFLNSLARAHSYLNLRPTSLLLTMLPNQNNPDHLDYEDRQVIFTNILRQLESRGIVLKRQYPILYRDLVNFVETNAQFSPTTIYPTDRNTNQTFVCMIAPQTYSVTPPSHFDNLPSNRSSYGSFMAELEAVSTTWDNCRVTEI